MTGWRTAPREVRQLVVSHGLSATAMGLPWPALLALVWDSSHSDLWLGVAATARLLPYVLVSWLAGRLADRLDRMKVVRASLIARLMLLAVTALCATSGHTTLAVVCATVVVAAGTPAYPALAAAMPGLSGPANEATTGMLVTFEVAAFFVGPALGGLALGFGLTAASCWAAAAVTAVALGLAVTAMARCRQGWVGPRAVDHLAQGAESVGNPRVARSAIAGVALDNAVAASLAIALLPLAEHGWGATSRDFGLATAAVGIGAFAAPGLLRVWGIDVDGGRRSAVVLALVVAAAAVSPSLAFAAIPLAAFGAASVHVEAVATGLIQRATPDHARSAALGLADSVMVAAAAAAAAITPWVCSLIGARSLLACCVLPALALRLLLPAEVATLAARSDQAEPAVAAA